MNQKWNLQDIRPAEPRKRRSLQDGPPPSATTPIGEPVRSEPQMEREQIPSIIIEDGTKKGNKRVLFSVVLFVVVVGGALLLSALLGKTVLTVFPQHREPNINSEFTAYPDKRQDALTYEVMTLDATSESQVKASGQVDVETQATGKIEIIKTTPGTERVIKNTRFRAPDGKIFRIKESVVIPGSVNNVPGTIQAEVFADQAGEEYNLPIGTRFNVPGFEESGLGDLYNAIYAENKSAFIGGFKGPQFQIDETELGTARQALQVKLRDDLLARVEQEKPNGFLTFQGLSLSPTINYQLLNMVMI